MTITIPDIMREIRNGFPTAVLEGRWQISNGTLSPSAGLEGCEFIALEGSRQDGVHLITEDAVIPGAKDEAFTGQVWLLKPPTGFLKLCQEIIAWAEKNDPPAAHSESFGAYSRTALTSGGKPLGWQEVFASALRPYRQMFSEVRL